MSRSTPRRKAKAKEISEPKADIVIVPTLRGGPAAGAQEQAERAATALPALGAALAEPAAAFWANVTKAGSARPSTVEVRLGLSFEGGTSWAIVAKVGATVDVTLTWNADTKGGT